MKTRAEVAPLILSLGLAGFVVMGNSAVVSPIVPAIARDIGGSLVQTAAMLIAGYMLPFALFQLLYGPLADRYGKLRVLRVTLLGFILTGALTALGAGLTDLTIYRALTGACAAGIMPVSLALIGDTVRLEERQAAIGSFMGISFLGQGLSMAIGGAFAFFVSWRGVFLFYAALSAMAAALVMVRSRGLAAPGNPTSEIVAPYRRLLTQGRSLRTYLVVLAEGALMVSSLSYLGAYRSHQFRLDNLSIGLLMTAFGAAAVAASRGIGGLAGRIGRRRTVLLGLLLGALSAALIALPGGALAIPILVVAIGFLGAGTIFAHSTLLTLATEFAAQARGAAMSLVAFCMMCGGAIGTSLGERVVEATSFVSFFGLWAILLVVLAGVTIAVVSDTFAHPTIEAAPRA